MLALCQLPAEHRNPVLCCEHVLSFSVSRDQVWHDDRVLEATARVTAATVIIPHHLWAPGPRKNV